MRRDQCLHDCIIEYHENTEHAHRYCENFKNASRALIDLPIKHLCCYPNDFPPVKKEALFLLHQNMRSLDKNITNLESFLNCIQCKGSITPTIIGVTETWLSSVEQTKLKRISIPGYDFLYQNREKGIRGGVGMYIKNNFNYTERDDIHLSQGESKWIETTVQGHKLIIGVVYSSEKFRNKKEFIE